MEYITSVEQIGFERGKQESRQEIAVNLFSQGIAIEVIAQATGLSAKTLRQIQADVQVNPANGACSD
jgi:predicted transposase/invertase (TIGR01784 family)